MWVRCSGRSGGKSVWRSPRDLWFLAAVDYFRASPLSGIGEAVFARGQDSGDVSHFVATSNEAFAAHFSLYGVLEAGTEPKFGYSLYSLACSVIPRVLWP